MTKLAGVGAIVTGASMGLGRAIAETFVRHGANVAVCARDPGALAETESALRALAGPAQVVMSCTADVSHPEDVARFVERAGVALPRLDVLVNNAGILGPTGLVEDNDWEQWVSALQVNLFGTVLTTRAVLPIFKRNGRGKIINLSGGGATGPRPRVSAYAASKAAVVRFTETVAEETRGLGIDVNAVAPGALNTRLLGQVVSAGPDQVGADEYRRSAAQQDKGQAGLERSAELCAFLASAQSDGITGKLLSAVWDPWESLGSHREILAISDIYTLRRIVPQDRGETW